MGLRLAKDIRAGKPKQTGFGLTFTEGLTYNLDELISGKNRADAERGLVIEVKKSERIAEKAIEVLKTNIEKSVSSTINEEAVENEIANIIKSVYDKYGCTYINMPEKAYNELNFLVNKMLRRICSEYKLNFRLEVNSSGANISYDFDDNENLNKEFAKLYDMYSDNYEEYFDVSEGGLAISDRKSSLRISKLDYEKYLLDDEGRSYQNKTPKSIGVGPTKIRIMWEDGTEDTYNNSSDSIYMDPNIILSYIEENKKLILENSEKFKDKQDTLISGITIKTINGATLLGEGDIPVYLKNEIEEMLKKYFKRENLSSIGLSELKNDMHFLTEHQDISHLLSKEDGEKKFSEVNNSLEGFSSELENVKENYALKNELFSKDYNDLLNKPDIPSLDGYATEKWVEEKNYLTEHQDISHLLSKDEGNNRFSEVESSINNNKDEIDEIKENYALKNELFSKNYNDLLNKPEIPVLDGYATEDWVENKKYLTEHQSLDGYATEKWIEEKNYLTEHQDISHLAEKSELFSKDYNDLLNKPNIPSLDGYATEDWVEEIVKSEISELVGTAPEELNNISELASTLLENKEIINSITETIPEINGEIQSLKELNESTNTEISSMKENILDMSTTSNSLSGRISALEETLGEINSILDILNGEVE